MFGCLEPTMMTQMAKFLDTLYVSGWQSSLTASSTDEPSPDLADYPIVGDLAGAVPRSVYRQLTTSRTQSPAR